MKGYGGPGQYAAPERTTLPPLQAGEYYAVVAVEGVDSTLNVREGASLNDRVVGVLRNGSRLVVMEETEDGWARMKTAEIQGYVSMSFITREGEGVSDSEAHVF